MKTRKQHLISRLSNDFNFIYIEPYKKYEHLHFKKKVDNIVLYTIPTFKLGSKLLESIFYISVIRVVFFLIQKFYFKIFINKKIDVQIISNPSFIQLINNKIPIIWDYNDNPFQFATPPSWLLNSFNKFLLKKSMQIWASSKQLNDNLKNKKVNNVNYIPNGVDVEFFKNVGQNKCENFTIGYVGILSSWFFDFDLIKSISKNFPNVIIKLIGPKDPLATKEIQDLTGFNNIKVIDKVDYKKLPKIMSSFDVGIIPLKQKDEVYQLSSAKFLQYLAVGIPIVSVQFIEFKEFEKNVYFCNSNNDFLNSIELLIENKADYIENKVNLENFNWDKISIDARNLLHSLIN